MHDLISVEGLCQEGTVMSRVAILSTSPRQQPNKTAVTVTLVVHPLVDNALTWNKIHILYAGEESNCFVPLASFRSEICSETWSPS